ncbi:hypothetical protein N7457_003262 [Penicillium paradoxum]|uniref:uncharacterized protein n=1 Tax=Penicillium paradoxum TaxID=176176 RepID=UPI002548BEEA|nr:uncharacterized protein N7457_003262 [Penicillium paradoxum]KAJ5788272.1 hypothetical protein N7457_003262 [Penicillium paradoxum]
MHVELHTSIRCFREALKNLQALCDNQSGKLDFGAHADSAEETSDGDILNNSPYARRFLRRKRKQKIKKPKYLFNSDEGYEETSESDTDHLSPKSHHQQGTRQRKTVPDSDGEGNEIENDGISGMNIEFPRCADRRNTKEKATKDDGHTKDTTGNAINHNRYLSRGRTGISSAHVGRDRVKPIKKRLRDTYFSENSPTDESSNISLTEDIKTSSHRNSHGSAKRKRVATSGGATDSTNEQSEMDESGRQSSGAHTEPGSVKMQPHKDHRNKMAKMNIQTDPVKDLIGDAMAGLALEGDPVKKAGRDMKVTKHRHREDSYMHGGSDSEEASAYESCNSGVD